MKISLRKLVTIVALAATFVLGIVCFIVLPDPVRVQISNYGGFNTMAKVPAVLLSYILTGILVYASLKRDEKAVPWLGFVGVLVQILMLAFN